MGLCSNGLDAPAIFSAEQLNRHFSNTSFDPLIEPVINFIQEIDGEAEQLPLFSFSEVTLDHVSAAIDHFSTEARGQDDLPKSVICAAFPVIGQYLLDISNSSIRESVVPSAWKKSLILATNKVASPKTMGEMRPIALLCFFSKVLERLMYLQLNEYVETCSLLDPFQTGYRAGHCTLAQTILLKLTEDARAAVERKHVKLLLLFDFSKAFDTVCHVVLMHKLKILGLSKVRS